MEHRAAIVYDPETIVRALSQTRGTVPRPYLGNVVIFLLLLAATSAAAADLPASLADQPLYRVAENGVLQRSENGGGTWLGVRGLPSRVLPDERAGESLPVTAFATDPDDRRRIIAAVGSRLFHSDSAGAGWTEVDLGETLNASTYLTAIALSPVDGGRWAVGTSYDGIYLTWDGGQTCTRGEPGGRDGPFYRGAGFYEEIADLEFEPDGQLLIRAAFGAGFAVMDPDSGSSFRLRPVADGPASYRSPAAVRLPPGAGSGDADDGAAQRRASATGKTGIYVSAANASTDRLPGYFDLIRRNGFNSIVVDFKDDFGRITYDTELETPRRVGSVEAIVDVPSLVRAAREKDIYVIARIVLFKDPVLYRFEGGRLALWDVVQDRPWGVYRTITDEQTGDSRVVQVEHWVDPYSREVRDYNLDIAEEAVALGVDEIQFDYVRFPSDGDTSTLASRFAPDGADSVQALENFLSEARARLSVPIGIDVFGFNAWSRMSYLGQDIDRLARYVDVISPMFYPSHFARSFLPRLTYLDRSREIYDSGSSRAREISGALIRPYVQAFLIGPELEYEQPEYFRYLDLQLEGLRSAGADGFTLWNASGRYYMLR
jgi:hypothetical protein